MWVLETVPPRWLAPNKTYTIGRRSQRTHPDFISLDGTSISRNHLSIQVGNPNAASEAITPVKLTDLKSKFGSAVNNEQLSRAKTFTDPLVELKLGPSSTIKMVWKPVNISFSTGEKDQAQKVMWDHATRALEPLDIKLSSSITGSTTHFMKGTHLTSKLALALALNLPVINTQFLDAIQSIASSLEDDFNNWPQESQFLGDPLWAPNPARADCLGGQKFVVYEEAQYSNLKQVIDATGGTIRLANQAEALNSDEILLKPQNKSLLDGTSAKVFTENAYILDAIKHATAVQPQTSVRKRPQKAGLMDFLTASSQVPISQNQSQRDQSLHKSQIENLVTDSLPPSSQRKRPARATLMDHMVGKKQKLDQVPESSVKTEPESVEPLPKRARIAASYISDPATITTNHTGRLQDPDTRGPTPQASTKPKEGANPSEPFIDLDTTLSGLALVERTLVVANSTLPARESNSKWAGRADFKAFRRKSARGAVSTTKSSPSLQNRVCFSVYDSESVPDISNSHVSHEPEISFLDTGNLPTRQNILQDDGGEFGFTFS